jgi:hypothetical protein
MRTLPKAPGVSTDQYTLKWDAWNRLVDEGCGVSSRISLADGGHSFPPGDPHDPPAR